MKCFYCITTQYLWTARFPHLSATRSFPESRPKNTDAAFKIHNIGCFMLRCGKAIRWIVAIFRTELDWKAQTRTLHGQVGEITTPNKYTSCLSIQLGIGSSLRIVLRGLSGSGSEESCRNRATSPFVSLLFYWHAATCRIGRASLNDFGTYFLYLWGVSLKN